jgi:hypothetical protein
MVVSKRLPFLIHRFPTHIIRGSPALFAFYTLSASPVFVWPPRLSITRADPKFFGAWKKNSRKTKRSQIFIEWHTVTGGEREHTLSGKVTCLCECEDRGASPTLNTMVNFQILSTQSIADNESIVDKVVLIKSSKQGALRWITYVILMVQTLLEVGRVHPQQAIHASRPVVRDTLVIFRLTLWEWDRLSLRDDRMDYLCGKTRFS